MKILLDAYFDNNFGDDLFFHILSKRYSEAVFYVFRSQTHSDVLRKLVENRSVVVLPEDCVLQEQICFDAYVMIGGDVLPDGVNYIRRLSWMKHVKEQDGYVAMLGFSLYAQYGEKTIQDLAEMYSLADVVVTRDTFSAERFCSLVPGAEIIDCADMAFVEETALPKLVSKTENPILGISVRRKLYSTDEENEVYCDGIAAAANKWLESHGGGRVRFLAFSTGEYDDRVTAEHIIQKIGTDNATEVVAYTDEIDAFIRSIVECSALIATRFHALVFALKFEIPFIPVPYEDKCTQLLDEVGYFGERIPYGESLDAARLPGIMAGLERLAVESGKLDAYKKKAEQFFTETDKWYAKRPICKDGVQPALVCNLRKELELMKQKERMAEVEIEGLKSQVQEHVKQIKELEKWIASLKEERAAFEKQNNELQEVRTAQLAKIEQITMDYSNLEQEYTAYKEKKKKFWRLD